MNNVSIRESLDEVISEIQEGSSLECPQLTETLVPATEVPSFDSKVWLIATTMLSAKIEFQIPDAENIFVCKDTNQPCSVSEICKRVSEIIEESKKSEKAA